MQVQGQTPTNSNVNYAGDGQGYHNMDIYIPNTNKAKYPVIVVVYGSAWLSNSGKGGVTNFVQPLLNAGFAVVAPNHRSSSDAKFPAQINDIKACIRFIRGNAATYKFDVDFIGITGASSGGHLSALAGTSGGVQSFTVGNSTANIEGAVGSFTSFSSSVAAICDWYGPTEMLRMDSCGSQLNHNEAGSPESSLVGGAIQNNKDKVALASPLTYIDAQDPPFLIIHGDADQIVPFCQSTFLNQALLNKGVSSEFITAPGAGHGDSKIHNDTFYKKMVDFFLGELDKTGNTDTPPTITTDLSNVTLAEGQTLELTIGGSGSNLQYQWYKNDQPVSGTGTATLTSPSVTFNNDGDTYYVVITNDFGTVTSKTVTLTVSDFLGVKFLKTNTPIVIDGVAEVAWEEANEYELAKKLMTVDNSSDLSALVKVLYDDEALYFYYNVVDDAKRASSTNFWENDAVEIYIDGNNDKATTYDANDFQFVIRYDASTIIEGHDKSTTGIQAKTTVNDLGYVMEVKIPWTTLGVTPGVGKQLGVDFHVNDSDVALRDGKVAWFATADNSYSDPSTFGSGRLESTVITSSSDNVGNTQLLYPNPFNDKFSVKSKGDFELVVVDVNGREVMHSSCVDACTFGSEWLNGVYLVKIITDNGVNSLKLLKK